MANTHALRASLALAINFLAILAAATNDTNSTLTTLAPTSDPTQLYTTGFPTLGPTSEPTTFIVSPTMGPSMDPSIEPTMEPTVSPSSSPTESNMTTTSLITTGFPTSEPTAEPTLEPTVAGATDAPTAAPTEPTYTEVEIVISITFEATNATEAQLIELILDALEDVISTLNLTVRDFEELTAEDIAVSVTLLEADSDAARRRLLPPEAATYSFTITLSVLDEDTAALIESVESAEFAAALRSDIESSTYSEIAEDGLSVSAGVVPEEDEDDEVDWLDWRTWQLINWLIVGGALLVLCVLALCLARCCCLLCCCKESRERRKSQYRVGGAMFDRVDSHNTGKEKQFQSDLRQAIEMNKRGKLLKKSAADEESLDLEPKAISAAFDMNFDEKTPINGAAEEKEKATAKGDAGAAVVGKAKESEGADETKDPLMRGATPGGPDDDGPVPPAPNPPAMSPEEEEHAAAYDLL